MMQNREFFLNFLFFFYFFNVKAKVSVRNLFNKNQTGREMHRLIDKYSGDLENWEYFDRRLSDMTIEDFFDFVKDIPYKRDFPGIEKVIRPNLLLYWLNNRKKGMDCKKKSILFGGYCRCNNIPYRLIACSERPDRRIHHVFPIGFMGNWVSLDATYPFYKFNQKKRLTYAETI